MTTLLHSLTNPDHILRSVGLIGLAAIVFAETGLLVGFFLPGDSLLFAAGLLTAQLQPLFPLWAIMLIVPVAAIAGDQCGYAIGRGLGQSGLRDRHKHRTLEYGVAKSEAFFAAHGPRAVILARFVPVARTIVPTLAGASAMPFRQFLTYNVIGAVAWGLMLIGAGHFLGNVEFIRDHVELIVIAIVCISLIPVAIHVRRYRGR